MALADMSKKDLQNAADVLKGIFGDGGVFDTALKTDATPNSVPPHGVNALLNTAGVKPGMYSTVVQPSTFAEALPLFQSGNENEVVEVITGVTADSGTNPNTACENPAVSGFLKSARITRVFGQMWFGTKNIVIPNSISRKNRADTDRNLLNWAGTPRNQFTPDVIGQPGLNTIYQKELLEWAHAAARNISHVNIQGDDANTGAAAQSGFLAEWDGLDVMIATGYAAAALDPNVTNYAAGLIDATWYTHFANVVRTQMMLAKNAGFGDVVWLAVVHPYAMYPIIDTVSCAFNSTRCSTSDTTGRSLDVMVANTLRESMMMEMYIPVDNKRIPFVTDWSVPATYNAATNVWTSEMYLVPLMAEVGTPLTYMEYLPIDNPLSAGLNLNAGTWSIHNNGMYLARRAEGENLCINFKFYAKMRLMLDTPFLAAKIDNFTFVSNTPFTSPLIGDQYYRNGGTYVNA